MSKTALLVIDVQRVFDDDDTIPPCPRPLLTWPYRARHRNVALNDIP
ncbi:MAG: hypothetical protein ACRBM6_00570 [Geminicoccales bacterium]